jgi:probable F420-dependent oxidoreductase
MENVKIRVGYGLGVRTKLNDTSFLEVVDTMENLRFDSLWLSERISGDAPDPLVAMSMAAARTTKMKFGMSVMVLPGRNPVVLAKELATLDRMSNGRLLPAFGLGVADPVEQQAFGVERTQRAKMFNEALEVVRACWSQESVTFHGNFYNYDNLQVQPKPKQTPPDVWLGGIADSELKRVGRLADGWLPSFVTPDDAKTGWNTITQVANEHGREIDPEHFGVLIPYVIGEHSEKFLESLRTRRPDIDDIATLVPNSWATLSALIEKFVAVGASKFVVIPSKEPGSVNEWNDHLADAATHLLPLQT